MATSLVSSGLPTRSVYLALSSSPGLGKDSSDKPQFLFLDRETRYLFKEQMCSEATHGPMRRPEQTQIHLLKLVDLRQLLLNVFPKGAIKGNLWHPTQPFLLILPVGN